MAQSYAAFMVVNLAICHHTDGMAASLSNTGCVVWAIVVWGLGQNGGRMGRSRQQQYLKRSYSPSGPALPQKCPQMYTSKTAGIVLRRPVGNQTA